MIAPPSATRLLKVCDATWPPAATRQAGAWTVRDGRGGGKRVSATTEIWPTTEADLPAAEAAMRALGQPLLFQVRDGEEALDEMLAQHGYEVVDPVNIWATPVAALTQPDMRPEPGSVFAIWPPLSIMAEIWADGGIGAHRQAVMARADVVKSGFLARAGDEPAGVGFGAVHDNVVMVHALHVLPAQRRKGAGRALLFGAAFWAAEQGADWLSLIVTRGNHAANPLYASLGMQLVGHYHYRRKPEPKGA